MSDTFILDSQHTARLREWIDEAQHVVITSHRNADGDAIGSSLAMMHLLCNRGIDAHVLLPNGCPITMRWLPGSDTVVSGDSEMERCQQLMNQADLVIGLDYNRLERIAHLEDMQRASTARKVLIDHHLGPDEAAFDLVFSYPSISSTCELLYWLAIDLWSSDAVDKVVATCLYTGIRTDTGGLTFSCSQPSLYRCVGDLVDRGIHPDDINHHIVDNMSAATLQFIGFVISNRLCVFEEHKFAYIYLTDEDLQSRNIDIVELEGLVNYTLRMQSIEVGALLREEKTRIKLSLRSKYNYNVERIAREYFGGGGHRKASGADFTNTTLNDVRKRIEQIFLHDEAPDVVDNNQ